MTRTLVGALLLAAAPLVAQEEQPLTRTAADAVAAAYNRMTTSRVVGATVIAPGARIDGDLASLGGPLTVAGTVDGDVLVINGDVRIQPGARVTGSLTVTAGRVTGDTAAVAGPITLYSDALRFRQEEGRIIALEPSDGTLVSQPTWFGRSGLNVAVDGAYNRVEGLPITLGPRLERKGTNPTILDARVIYRTGNGFQVHPDELGHDVWIEQYLGGHRSLRIGAGWHRVIDPIETRGLTDVENSLSTFILHRDLRDHYIRNGWRAYLAYTGRTQPVEAGVEYRHEEHGSVESRTPWSLLDNDEPWRAQPLVAEGDLRLVRGWIRWDTRNDRDDPSAGWLLEAEVEQGVEGALTILRPNPDAGGEPFVAQPVNAEYTTLRLDARRYLRLGPRTRLVLRAAATGSPDDGALPPQRQQVLGGEGSLPGYSQFAFDCGARSAPEIQERTPYYGCDRAILFQAEYRFAFFGSGGIGLGRSLGLDFDLATTPELVLFADAGRAWIEDESLGDRLAPGPTDLRYDVGVGVRFGRIGVYLAAPISDGGDGVNVFLRLGPRI
ncbi:MAG: BamA/TamA family outer membrane protein [Candidatus Longimicrobiales bacterium M2_2A_002]